MGNFYTDVVQHDPRFHTRERVADTALLEPVTRAAVAAIVADAAEQGIVLEVTETYRSTERQAELFAQGATQLRTVGVHHYGLAADFAKRVGGGLSWAGDWTFLGVLAKKHGLIWGGDWGTPDQPHSFRDWDHVQRIAVADQQKLFAGKWYPDSAPPAVAPLTAAATAPAVSGAPNAAASPAASPPALTPAQSACLAIVDRLNATEFSNWFRRSSVLATIQVESAFRAQAYRYEPALGEGSYGLMQVLASTAAGLGLSGEPDRLFDPATGARYGMMVLRQGWDLLDRAFGRPPTWEEWCAGYNEGYGAVERGRSDPAYVAVWMAARRHWAAFD
ncbi:MAG: transglycosylase SLT domain-containing protein [Alphaproteobacteria bacterium]|nr:transglycosylase SLT domain-containing protein [Alphaproteobacteria bacterium]